MLSQAFDHRLVNASTAMGAILGGLGGRYVLRRWASSLVDKSAKFQALDQALTDKAFLLIFLVRLSPVMPFGL